MWIIEEQLFKTIDKKEITVSLKKKKFFFGSEEIDSKKFKLVDLATKCEQTKEMSLGANGQFKLIFQMHSPLKGKDFEEIPT
jgi:hypothetical protein